MMRDMGNWYKLDSLEGSPYITFTVIEQTTIGGCCADLLLTNGRHLCSFFANTIQNNTSVRDRSMELDKWLIRRR